MKNLLLILTTLFIISCSTKQEQKPLEEPQEKEISFESTSNVDLSKILKSYNIRTAFVRVEKEDAILIIRYKDKRLTETRIRLKGEAVKQYIPLVNSIYNKYFSQFFEITN